MNAGISLNFTLGQRVIYDGMHGWLKRLSIEDDGIMGTVILDEPIVIPPIEGLENSREVKLYQQTVPVYALKAEEK